MSNTNITTTTETTTVVVEENIVRIELNNIGVQGVPGANTDPTYVTVRNATGATLPKGTIVYISGANGNNVQVTPAIANSDATSARTLGWLSAAIANNASGLCMVEGYLEGINTQSFNAGDQLYLSGTVAGGFTATKPVAPIHLVYVGVVTKKSAGDGHVFVKVQNGYELGELHDVLITSPTNNQVLTYNAATDLWVNATNAPDGVTSITATAPLTGGTITSTGSIGLDQTALSITRSQVSDFTSGTVTSASTAQQAGTAVYAVNAGTAVYATTSGTAVYSANSGTAVTISGTLTKSQVSDFTSGTVAQAGNATTSGTAVYATNSGTAVFATTAGTSTTISGNITRSQVSDFTSGTVAQATNASTAVSVSGSAITQSQVVNLVSDLANTAKLNTANTFSVGGHVINNDATGTVPIRVNAIAGQTANLFEIRDSAATNYVAVNSAGSILFGGNSGSFLSGANGRVNVQLSGDNIGLTVRAFGSQTANLLQLQNSSGGVIGGFTAPVNNVSRLNLGGTDLSATLGVTVHASGGVGAVIRGAASQSANLMEIQSSAGTILSRFSSSGQFVSDQQTFVGSGAASISNSRLNVATGSSSVLGLTVRGASAQTADLFLLQNNGGTTQFRVDPNGMTIANSLGVAGSPSGISYAYFTTPAANAVPVVIRGAASQTANLLEIQSSAASIVSRIDSAGNLRANIVQTLGAGADLREGSGGGGLATLIKMGSLPGAPGANAGRLYFRDGTNAGTLKLVVRAGAAGAETTILDNIPQ